MPSARILTFSFWNTVSQSDAGTVGIYSSGAPSTSCLKAREKAFCALSDRVLKRGMVQKKGEKKRKNSYFSPVEINWV
jgi:hypothetical protein